MSLVDVLVYEHEVVNFLLERHRDLSSSNMLSKA
jgi:hypothetical protein